MRFFAWINITLEINCFGMYMKYIPLLQEISFARGNFNPLILKVFRPITSGNWIQNLRIKKQKGLDIVSPIRES